MKILLFGVSNVGKTTIGKLLAEKIKFSFYDLDDEIKKYYGITLEEFVHTENLRWRDQKRGQIINKILKLDENMVLAITPISYPDNFEKCIVADDILLIELCDSPENIFSRLVFSDEEDNLYIDLQYKNEHKEYYRNLLGGLYRENPVKSRNYEAVKSSKKWENVGNSYIIPALLLYRYSYI